MGQVSSSEPIVLFCIPFSLLERTLDLRPPSLTFTSAACSKIRRELESHAFTFRNPASPQSMYNEIVNCFLKYAKEKASHPVNEIESWERFIPETLRLVIVIFCHDFCLYLLFTYSLLTVGFI